MNCETILDYHTVVTTVEFGLAISLYGKNAMEIESTAGIIA